jgi:hypothetical protein
MLLRPGHLRERQDCLRERSSGVFLKLRRIKGSGEGDIILNYIKYMMSQIWLNTYKLID